MAAITSVAASLASPAVARSTSHKLSAHAYVCAPVRGAAKLLQRSSTRATGSLSIGMSHSKARPLSTLSRVVSAAAATDVATSLVLPIDLRGARSPSFNWQPRP